MVRLVQKSKRIFVIICSLVLISNSYSQNNDLQDALSRVRMSDTIFVLTKTDINERLRYINEGCTELNEDLFAANNSNATIEQIELLNKRQTFLIQLFEFVDEFCGQFLIKDIELNANLNTVKNSIYVITKNTETLSENFYKKNATLQIGNLLFDGLYKMILFQYPYLEKPLNMLLKYYGLQK